MPALRARSRQLTLRPSPQPSPPSTRERGSDDACRFPNRLLKNAEPFDLLQPDRELAIGRVLRSPIRFLCEIDQGLRTPAIAKERFHRRRIFGLLQNGFCALSDKRMRRM